MMDWSLPVLGIGILGNLILGLIVFVRNRKSATSMLFFLLSIDIGLWSVANFAALRTGDLLSALYWTRIVMSLAVPQAVLFFLLIHTLPSKHMSLPAPVVSVIGIIAAATSVLCLGQNVFSSVIFVHGAPSPTPGPAMPLFGVVAIGSVVAGIWTLVRRLRSARGTLRVQLQVIGAGIVAMFGLIVFFNFFLVVVFQTSAFVAISPLYTLPFVGATAYAIIRHKFLDIRLVVARTVSYTILMSLFGLTYALVFAVTSSLIVSPYIDPKFIAISTAAALVMLLTFPGLKRLIERTTDAVFYKDKYDASQVLYGLTQIMARTLRLEDLTHQFLRQLNTEFRAVHSCIVLLEKGRVFAVIAEGRDRPPEVVEHAAIAVARSGVTRNRDDDRAAVADPLFDSLDVSVLLPLSTSQRVIGLLCISEKRSGEPYSDEDVRVLEIIASEVAVAIENSLSYEEIRRFSATLEDEVKRATDDLLHANEKLEQLDKLKDEFVSLASHELRTPLTAIRSYLWMALSGKGGDLSEKQQYYLDRSFASTNRLIKLVNDMLNISRIESGRMSVQFGRADIRKVVAEVVSEVQPKIDEQGLRLVQTIPDPVPDVIADVDKIKEVLVNFFSNAIKFTPRGGMITLRIALQDAEVRVYVSDSGIGFLPAEADKLFRKFGTLLHVSGKNEVAYQSTGLGLYISKSIVEMHGGTITAASEGIGKGAMFSFTLPVYSPQKREEMQRRHAGEGVGIIHSAAV